jgi:hypothetical protein
MMAKNVLPATETFLATSWSKLGAETSPNRTNNYALKNAK